jgi:hypothetical protein
MVCGAGVWEIVGSCHAPCRQDAVAPVGSTLFDCAPEAPRGLTYPTFLTETRTASYINEFDPTGSFLIGTGRATDIPYNRVSGDHCVWECEEPYGGGGRLVCVDGEFVSEGKCEVPCETLDSEELFTGVLMAQKYVGFYRDDFESRVFAQAPIRSTFVKSIDW